jgi:Fuc2NAc and GlcNAc transferase
MTVTGALTIGAAAFAVSWWLTRQLRAYALARRVLDLPNERSSHSVATPRGGGMAIAVTVLAGLAIAGWAGVLPPAGVIGFLGGGALVAAVGFADDHRHVPARWRLLGHFVAAAMVLTSISGSPLAPVGAGAAGPEWFGYACGLLFIVWLLNLTNFMDGIDGIAGVEAVTACSGGVLAYASVSAGFSASLHGAASPAVAGHAALWLGPSLMVAATGGFLVWNWPPARIFMGDGGSGFVGFAVAAFSLQAARAEPRLLWSWLILLGVFVVDATVTLARRTWRRETIYQPHRMHAYQHAAQRYGSHRTVTLTVAVVNVLWLWPLALLVARGSLGGAAGLLIAYAPLVFAAAWLGAGAPQANGTASSRAARQ